MLTAKEFLQKTDYTLLPEIIRSDPIRLRKEFLSIAASPEEHFLLRLRSLRILNGYAQMFGLFTPLERQSLITAFESEFPPERLQEVGEMIRSKCVSDHNRWLVFCYCIAIARITLNNDSEIVNSTREIYKGTTLGEALELYLDKIERLKSDGTSNCQMEAG